MRDGYFYKGKSLCPIGKSRTKKPISLGPSYMNFVLSATIDSLSDFESRNIAIRLRFSHQSVKLALLLAGRIEFEVPKLLDIYIKI